MTVATDPRKTGVPVGMSLIGSSAVAASVTGTTNETTLATVTIPGGAMGTNGGVNIITFWSYTASANLKTPRIKFGSTTIRSATRTTGPQDNLTDIVRNRNSASVQFYALGVSNAATSGQGTAAENTGLPVTLTITGQLALGTETLTLEGYEVWSFAQ